MSEAVIFEFPYNLFLKERLEFVVICQDELEAKIMRVIEYEMIKLKEAWQAKCELATEAKKPLPREPRDYWVRLSHSMIIARLYRFDSAWFKREKGKKEQGEEKQKEDKHPLLLSKSTLRNAINSLITKGFLVMRSKPGDEYGAPIYTSFKRPVSTPNRACVLIDKDKLTTRRHKHRRVSIFAAVVAISEQDGPPVCLMR